MTICRFPGVFILVFFSPLFSIGQEILYTHHSTGKLKDFSAVRLGDSLLFSFKDIPVNSRRVNHAVWLADSAVHPVDPLDADIFAAARYGHADYLYFIEEKSRSRRLKAWIYNDSTKARVESADTLFLHGKIIGSYVDRNLFVVSFREMGSELSLVEINRMRVVSEKRFRLPQPVAPEIAVGPVDFYTDTSEVNTFQGRSHVKVFKYDKLYVIYDLGSRTYVMTLDPQTGAADVKSFLASSEAADFRSFLIDGKLFRILHSKKKFQLDIFDLATSAQIAKCELTAAQPDFNAYFRYGRKNVIHHKHKFSNMLKAANVSAPQLAVLKRDGQYIVQWGDYYDENGMGGAGAGIIGMIVTTAILQMMEGPGLNHYFYYAWNEQQNSFQRLDPPLALVRDAIDCYEMDHVVRFEDKRYVAYRDGVAAIYYDSSANTVSVVYFH
jgi:hypothetical protein